MIRIGDFSKLGQVTIKALRHYDEMGLLKPVSVDQFTGYRYYEVEQLARLNRILALKDLGLSLEQVAQVLEEGVSPERLRGMLQLKQAELRQHISEEQERLTRVEARLNTITMEDTMSDYDVIIKQVETQLVASVRETLPTYPSIGRLIGEIYDYLHSIGADAQGTIAAARWYDDEYKTSDIDSEAVVYLKQPIPASERVKVYEIPAATVASVVHKGPYNEFSKAYEAAFRWMEANGYRPVGPNSEIYLYCTEPVRQDDPSYVTELQFPVEKINN